MIRAADTAEGHRLRKIDSLLSSEVTLYYIRMPTRLSVIDAVRM
jgi:hypothetical protein